MLGPRRVRPNDPLSTAIEAIYAAATEPAGWQMALANIGALVGAHAVTLIYADSGGGPHDIFAFHNMDVAQIERYNREFRGQDPTVAHSLSKPVGTFVSSADICSDEAWRRTPLYHELIRRDGMFYLEGSTLLVESGTYAALGYHRSERAGPAGGEERRLHDEVARHMRRALGIHRRLQRASVRADSFEETVERLALGVVLIDHRGRVHFANAAARRIAAEGDAFRIQDGTPRARHREDAATLDRLLANVLLPTDRALGGAVALRRASARAPIEALVVPLRTEHSAAAIFLGDPLASRLPRAEAIRRLYGLTPSEARVASDLADGHSLTAIADRIGVRVSTVRTHLKSILAKTSTHRQAELVRMLVSSPSTLIEPDRDTD